MLPLASRCHPLALTPFHIHNFMWEDNTSWGLFKLGHIYASGNIQKSDLNRHAELAQTKNINRVANHDRI